MGSPLLKEISVRNFGDGCTQIQLDFDNDSHHVTCPIQGNREEVAYVLMALAKALLKDKHLD